MSMPCPWCMTAPVSRQRSARASWSGSRPRSSSSWRPATWILPDGRTRQTVLGNDHAVVIMGFNETVVAIRDVLGPTSSNWQRPYEYEVDWDTFMKDWYGQSVSPDPRMQMPQSMMEMLMHADPVMRE